MAVSLHRDSGGAEATALPPTIKLLVVTDLYPNPTRGGPRPTSDALHRFVRQWARQPLVEARVVVPVPSATLRVLPPVAACESLVMDGVSVSIVRVWSFLRRHRVLGVRPIAAVLEQEGFLPDVIVSHMPTGTACAVRLNRRWKRPHIAGIHSKDIIEMRREPDAYARVSGFAYRSPQIQTQARGLADLPRGFVAVSGIEAEQILPADQYLARRLHTPLRLITVATLIERKNVDAVLRALARLPGDVPWEYAVYGDGPTRCSLEALSEQLGLADRVRFFGRQARAACLDAMEQADIFVMISRDETFGLVYLEAMARGALVVAARGTGVDGVIEHAGNGFLCNPGDPEELSALLEQIATRDLEPIRRNALETIRQHTEEDRAQAYLDYIVRVATGESSLATHRGTPLRYGDERDGCP